MDRDGAKTGYDLDLLKAMTFGGLGAGDRLGRRPATHGTWSEAVTRGGGGMRCWRASIFHFGEGLHRRP